MKLRKKNLIELMARHNLVNPDNLDDEMRERLQSLTHREVKALISVKRKMGLEEYHGHDFALRFPSS
ncbi:MAG: hypothetical protein AAF657_03625 [Acidobacteriota bacterium]